jgi:hypothetical protein
MNEFESELRALINRHNVENSSETPDFVLAKFMLGCLNAYGRAVNERDAWYGQNTPTWARGPVSL